MHLNIIRESLDSIIRNRVRTFVIIACLVAVILPFITAMAISEGIKYQSDISINAGADLYISSDQYGKNGPISLEKVEEIEKIPGVIKAVPRIVGRTYLGEEVTVIVGIDNSQPLLDHGEVLMGRVLADKLDVSTGHDFHFYLLPSMSFKIKEVIDPKLSISSSSLVVMPFSDAEKIFKIPGKASEILVYTRPGTSTRIADTIATLLPPWIIEPPLRIQTKSLVNKYVSRGFDLQSGIFSMFYITAFALLIPALMILAGFGKSVRNREIGIMKACGWRTYEILEKIAFENFFIALIASLLSVFLAMVWLKIGNGIGVAPLFISGVNWWPEFTIPSKFMPLPVALTFLFSTMFTMIATIVPTWKSAVRPPLNTIS